MPVFTKAIGLSVALIMLSVGVANATHLEDRSTYSAPQAKTAIRVDGIADDAAWEAAEWREIKYRWLGPEYTAEDFNGRFKVVWTPERIYLLAEIEDDILYDAHRDPLVQYWDDDCLEIFIDQDYSGGEHHFSHNAFAYHMSLDNRAIDIGTDGEAREYTDHTESRWRQEGDKIIWEVAIELYDDSYVDDSDENEPVELSAGKVLGLMVAYCDNDGSELRENFIGSESVPTGPKDRGYIDAGLFGKVVLDE
ncbi:MAG: sugar-binding protein [Woeseiaceae bacterium]|nr:sugar-binding protein [Woeseiaceae bacterium]